MKTHVSRNGQVHGIDWQRALTEHARWLRTVVRARLSDSHAIDDVMQEVAVAALAQSAPLKDAAKVAPWLYRVAVRQVFLYRRRTSSQRKFTDRLAFKKRTEDSGDSYDPFRWISMKECREVVGQALNKLPARDREILMLKHTENWTYQQLADHLGVGFNTIEYRLLRARQRLRQELVARNIGEDVS